MKIELEAGYYELGTDVQNPKPDRRMKNNLLYYPVWPKGSRWRVEHFDHLPSRISTANGRALEYHEQVEAIMPHLVKVTPQVGHYIEGGCAASADAVLALMVVRGLLRIEQVELYAGSVDAMDEASYERMMRDAWIWND